MRDGRSGSVRSAFGRGGGQHHQHRPAFHSRFLFDDRHVLQVAGNLRQHLAANLRVSDLAASDQDTDFHLRAFREEPASLFDFETGVIIVGLGAEANLFDFDGLLSPARLTLALGLLVNKLTVIEQPADGRVGIGRDLDQVEVTLAGETECLARRENAQLLTRLVDQPDFPSADFFVYIIRCIANEPTSRETSRTASAARHRRLRTTTAKNSTTVGNGSQIDRKLTNNRSSV